MTPILLSFTVQGVAVPKQSFVYGRGGRSHTDPRVTDWQNVCALVGQNAMQQRELAPLTGPLKVCLEFYLPTRRRMDADNLSKAVLDALNGAIWLDDRQIVQLQIIKREKAHNPRVEITVQEAEE